MVIFKKIADLQEYLDGIRLKDRRISFVPTMGALHQGHISLIEKAREDGGFTVASIFVNPTQFNDKEDFEKYPITTGEDILMLTEGGCDVLFLPTVAEMYPEGPDNMQTYDFGYLETILEGAQRPGHFKGVGQVVARLLNIVAPDVLYMGQKDYQQCLIIQSLIQQLGIGKPEMKVGATTREADGLAMSSRNKRLTERQRSIAGLIYQCLVSIQAKQGVDPFKIVQKECEEILVQKGFAPEYVALANADDLTLMNEFDTSKRMVALIAAKLGNVRLIDNMLINP